MHCKMTKCDERVSPSCVYTLYSAAGGAVWVAARTGVYAHKIWWKFAHFCSFLFVSNICKKKYIRDEASKLVLEQRRPCGSVAHLQSIY